MCFPATQGYNYSITTKAIPDTLTDYPFFQRATQRGIAFVVTGFRRGNSCVGKDGATPVLGKLGETSVTSKMGSILEVGRWGSWER